MQKTSMKCDNLKRKRIRLVCNRLVSLSNPGPGKGFFTLFQVKFRSIQVTAP